MSGSLRSLIGNSFTRRASRKKASRDFYREGLERLNTKVFASDKIIDDNKAFVHVNGVTKSKLDDLYALKMKELAISGAEKEQSHLMKLVHVTLVPAVVLDALFHVAGFFNNVATVGYEEAKKRLIAKVTMNDEERLRYADKKLQDSWDLLKGRIEILNNLILSVCNKFENCGSKGLQDGNASRNGHASNGSGKSIKGGRASEGGRVTNGGGASEGCKGGYNGGKTNGDGGSNVSNGGKSNGAGGSNVSNGGKSNGDWGSNGGKTNGGGGSNVSNGGKTNGEGGGSDLDDNDIDFF